MYTVAVFIYLIINSNPAFGFEPDCSRFHYEEKTLEKMIRQEIAVEKMRAEIEDVKNKVIETLAEMKNVRNNIAVDFEKKANDIDAMKYGVEKAVANMKAQTDENLEAYSQEIEHMKDAAFTPLIAFRANKISDTSMTQNKAIVFTKNDLNIGNAYNNQTGIFVAPVRGIYLFTAQICVTSGSWAAFAIFTEDRIISSMLIADKDWYSCSNIEAITVIDHGEQVSVKCANSCESSESLWDEVNYVRNAFSGILLRFPKK